MVSVELAFYFIYPALLLFPFWIGGFVLIDRRGRQPKPGPHNGWAQLLIRWRMTRAISLAALALGLILLVVAITT